MVTIDEVYDKLNYIESQLKELEPTLTTIRKLQESGLIAILETIGVEFDNLFNYATSAELLGLITLIVKFSVPLQQIFQKIEPEQLFKVLDQIDIEKILPLIVAMTNCATKTTTILKATPKKMKLMELLNEVRSPEMTTLISSAKQLSNCLSKQVSSKK